MRALGLILTCDELRLAEADGERAWFAARMRDCEPSVTTLVWRLLGWAGSAQEVGDVVQEAFLLAWSRRAQLKEPAAFAGWVRAIAVRAARNHVRWQKRRRWLTFGGFEPGNEPVGESAGESAADETVREALGRLRHPDREVLVLRYLQELGVEEIADVLGIARASADQRLSRARRRLEVLLEGTA